jgi:hypothetical protein
MGEKTGIPDLRYRPTEYPPNDGPGIYFIFSNEDSLLPDFDVDTTRLLYIGKCESSFEARNHFQAENSAKSTLRRSLGSILRAEMALLHQVLPRRTLGKITRKSIQNYRFSEAGERWLSEWMLTNLSYGFMPVLTGIRSLERQYIEKWKPVLNLIYCNNPHKGKLEKLREECRNEASRWNQNNA